jgi:prevent-host-death family protein
MEVGIKQAKTNLSKLIADVQQGKRVFVTNQGKRVVELVPVVQVPPEENKRGLGMFKDKIRLPPGWDTQKARRQASEELLKLMGIEN